MRKVLALVVIGLGVLAFSHPAGADDPNAILTTADLQFGATEVTLTIPPGNTDTFQLYVNIVATGEPIGAPTGTSGVLSVPYPPNFCGEIQADARNLTLNRSFGFKHQIENGDCTPPTTTMPPPTTTTTTTSSSTTTTTTQPTAPPSTTPPSHGPTLAPPVSQTVTPASTPTAATQPAELPFTGSPPIGLLALIGSGLLLLSGLLLRPRTLRRWWRRTS